MQSTLLVIAEYLVAVAVAYVIVATIGNRKLGAHIPVPSFLKFARPK